ncbi:hypothetical protein StoSoilB13_10890 [Arthrobacter sp. StoSoilB13]|nr:hypothetical protein StoSoilB13_10890 [Arthrobacter sp. StoSoilB13]
MDMPELPEVHGLCTYLDTQLHGAVLTSVRINSIAALKTADPPYSTLEGRTIQGTQRFGKFISLDADGLFFVFHLAKGRVGPLYGASISSRAAHGQEQHSGQATAAPAGRRRPHRTGPH